MDKKLKWERKYPGYYELYSENGLLLADIFRSNSRWDYPWDWQVYDSHHTGFTRTLTDAKSTVEFELHHG